MSRVTAPDVSGFASVQASAADDVAKASKPRSASSFAVPASHGLGMTKRLFRACSARNRAATEPLLLPERVAPGNRSAAIASAQPRPAARLERRRSEAVRAGLALQQAEI